MMDGESIGETILSGIQSANHDYETCSNGWWLTDSGAKGPIVSSIAERLCAMRGAGESVVLELPYRYILEWSGAGPVRGRPPQPLSGRGRADIVLLDNDGRPACVIDGERVWDRVRCFSSLTRLRDLVIQSHDRGERLVAARLPDLDAGRERDRRAKRATGDRAGGGADRTTGPERVRRQGVAGAMPFGAGAARPRGDLPTRPGRATGRMPASASRCRPKTSGAPDRRRHPAAADGSDPDEDLFFCRRAGYESVTATRGNGDCPRG